MTATDARALLDLSAERESWGRQARSLAGDPDITLFCAALPDWRDELIQRFLLSVGKLDPELSPAVCRSAAENVTSFSAALAETVKRCGWTVDLNFAWTSIYNPAASRGLAEASLYRRQGLRRHEVLGLVECWRMSFLAVAARRAADARLERLSSVAVNRFFDAVTEGAAVTMSSVAWRAAGDDGAAGATVAAPENEAASRRSHVSFAGDPLPAGVVPPSVAADALHAVFAADGTLVRASAEARRLLGFFDRAERDRRACSPSLLERQAMSFITNGAPLFVLASSMATSDGPRHVRAQFFRRLTPDGGCDGATVLLTLLDDQPQTQKRRARVARTRRAA